MSQDYQNRELVILSDGSEDYLELQHYATVRCSGRLRMKAVERGAMSLGALRNAAIDLAGGDIICQWDDDDFSHARRLSTQLALMQDEGADACFMTDQLQLITRTRSLYWCDWTRPRGVPMKWTTIPNTLFCRKDVAGRYPESGPVSRRSEDAHFMRSLLNRAKVAQLRGWGWLYVYVSHGANTWHENHHLDIIRATGMEARDLIGRRNQLASALAAYPLGRLAVRDYLGCEVYTVITGEP